MALIIIPLAGPDFVTKQFGIRPLYPVGDTTLLEYVLLKRPWIKNLSNEDRLVFILREEGGHTKKMCSFIKKRFPTANTVVLGALSLGAPLSALAGIALSKNQNQPVIIDLADIAFDLSWNPIEYFEKNLQVDAVVPYFISQDPKFSYLRLNGPTVLEAREKQVISSCASAGVYCFRGVSIYLQAVAYCLQHPDICKVGASFFVCPSINGLISTSRQVHALRVDCADPISALFHESPSTL